MVNFYIYEQSIDGKTCDVIFHIPISDTPNTAGISHRDAVANRIKKNTGSDPTSKVPDVTGLDIARIRSGEICEIARNIRFSRLGLTASEKRSEIGEAFKRLSKEVQEAVENELDLYGIAEDVK